MNMLELSQISSVGEGSSAFRILRTSGNTFFLSDYQGPLQQESTVLGHSR